MTTITKKITLSTVKSFIKNNRDNLFINVKSSFDGMTDCCESQYDGFVKVLNDKDKFFHSNSLGIAGAWFVGSSRDYFSPYEALGMKGISVSNSCGHFVLAIKVTNLVLC